MSRWARARLGPPIDSCWRPQRARPRPGCNVVDLGIARDDPAQVHVPGTFISHRERINVSLPEHLLMQWKVAPQRTEGVSCKSEYVRSHLHALVSRSPSM